MIDLYYWPTPNGWKVTILLEELGVPYTVRPVNITKGEQFDPAFLRISPNNRMPAIVDHDLLGGDGPLSVFESGAILKYLAVKHGRFYPAAPRAQVAVDEWLFWQVGGLGPMAGQAHHFRNYAPEPVPYGIDRYTREVGRLYGVLDKRLANVDYVAGPIGYSIADMAIWPWIKPWRDQGQDLEDFPHLKRWFDTVAARPAVVRGAQVGDALRADNPVTSDEARKILFGGGLASQ